MQPPPGSPRPTAAPTNPPEATPTTSTAPPAAVPVPARPAELDPADVLEPDRSYLPRTLAKFFDIREVEIESHIRLRRLARRVPAKFQPHDG